MQPVKQKNTTIPKILAGFFGGGLPALFFQSEGAGGARRGAEGLARRAQKRDLAVGKAESTQFSLEGP